MSENVNDNATLKFLKEKAKEKGIKNLSKYTSKNKNELVQLIKNVKSRKPVSRKVSSIKLDKPSKACKDDEELNPLTRRCRKKCKENEVRDDKGRCKKVDKKADAKKASDKKADAKKVSSKKVSSKKVSSKKVSSKKVSSKKAGAKKVYTKKVSSKKVSSKKVSSKKADAKNKFIFDYENICNNIGLISNASLYKQINFYEDEDKDKIEWNIKNVQGIFKDSKFLPVLNNVSKNENTKVLTYGNKYQIKVFSNIIAQGTYGIVYDAIIENTETQQKKNMIVKKPKLNSSLSSKDFVRNFVNETVIQAHLFCAYEKELQTNQLMRVPEIIMIGKIKEKKHYDYYVGMEKLSSNLQVYLSVLKGNHGLNSDIYAETFERVVNTVVNSLRFFQNKEKFVHRDLHCLNIMLDKNDNLYIIDFGQSILLNRDVVINSTIYEEVTNFITPTKSYVKSHYNKSHDFRLFLASLLYYKFVPDRFKKIIAKRFSNCAFGYYKKIRDEEYKEGDGMRQFNHCFYSDSYFIYDERFDVQVYPKMLEDYDDSNSNIPTLSPKDVERKKVVYTDTLMDFVKNNYK
jgi:hypothetical protein